MGQGPDRDARSGPCCRTGRGRSRSALGRAPASQPTTRGGRRFSSRVTATTRAAPAASLPAMFPVPSPGDTVRKSVQGVLRRSDWAFLSAVRFGFGCFRGSGEAGRRGGLPIVRGITGFGNRPLTDTLLCSALEVSCIGPNRRQHRWLGPSALSPRVSDDASCGVRGNS